jgi:hypothetical protein
VYLRPGILVRETLDIIWPLLPIVVYGYKVGDEDDDVVAALEHSDCICTIGHVRASGFEKKYERSPYSTQVQGRPCTPHDLSMAAKKTQAVQDAPI